MRIFLGARWAGAVALGAALAGCGSTEPSPGSSCPSSDNEAAQGKVSLGVGQQLVVQSPSDLCIFFAASRATESYLIGVQSTSEAGASLTPLILTATAEGGVPAVAAPELVARRTGGPGARRPELAGITRWSRHRTAEARLRSMERRMFGARQGVAFRGSTRVRGEALRVPSTVVAGDTVEIRVPGIDTDDPCGDADTTNFTTVKAVARVIGATGVWLEDVANPTGGYTLTDFQALSNQLDSPIYATDITYFGAPSDLDGNGRVVILITQAINNLMQGTGGGTLGFVFSGDLVPVSACASSNGGEIFYGIAPDEAGTLPFGVYTHAQAIADAPFIIAHELTHIIQFSRRIQAGLDIGALWMLEGQATLAEEVVGHAVEGRAPGRNLGADIAFNDDNPASIDWYSNKFVDLATYFGFATRDTKVEDAPEQCSFLTETGPCTGRDVYTSWSLLRWLSDQFGPAFPGGEQGLQRALVDNPGLGYENIANVVGVPITTLLAQWSAMLYVDDRVPGLTGRLTLPSWNLFEIFDGALVESAQLAPRARLFTNFTDSVSVRAASTAYFQVGGAGRPSTTIRATTAGGGPPPAAIQLYVVRLQ